MMMEKEYMKQLEDTHWVASDKEMKGLVIVL